MPENARIQRTLNDYLPSDGAVQATKSFKALPLASTSTKSIPASRASR